MSPCIGLVMGRFDTRMTGLDVNGAGENPTYDPSFAARNGAYIGAFMDYRTRALRVDPSIPYQRTADGLVSFEWTHAPREGSAVVLPDGKAMMVGGDLAATVHQNPKLRLFFANGYLDLATPFISLSRTPLISAWATVTAPYSNVMPPAMIRGLRPVAQAGHRRRSCWRDRSHRRTP
jgi:carboxypeptidase C (cathepsin A)